MSKPIIIALCGLAGAGKDTVADTLVTHAGFSKIAFADALRNEVAAAFNLGDQMCILTDRATKETPNKLLTLKNCGDAEFILALAIVLGKDLHNDEAALRWLNETPFSPRQILQWWGTEYRRAASENYWTTKVAMQILAGVNADRGRWVITDCRFPNEARAIRSIGGELWQVQRQHHTSVEGGHASQNDGTHFKPEAVVLNGSSITGLMHTTLRMLQHPAHAAAPPWRAGAAG